MDGLQRDLKRHYDIGFNDGLYHTVDFLKATAKDLANFPEDESTAQLLLEISDVLLEDIKKEHDD